MEQESVFWANIIAVAASPIAIVAGLIRGSYDAASGAGAFGKGFRTAADPVVAAAKRFGSEHGGTITTGLLRGIVTTLATRIANEGFDHLKK